jgi:hypothetical protein
MLILFLILTEKRSMNIITLPYANNAQFNCSDLIIHFRKKTINYMIIGSTQVALKNHPKPNSLDVWIRNHPSVVGYENTCQAVNKVISQIIKHNSFSLGLRKCPKSNRICKALVFCNNQITQII